MHLSYIKWSIHAVCIRQIFDQIELWQKIAGITTCIKLSIYMWYVALFKQHCHSQLSAKFTSTHRTRLNYQPLFRKGARTPLLREEIRPVTREWWKSSLTQARRWQDCEDYHRATTWHHSLLTTHPATCTARIPRFSLRPLRKIFTSDPVSIVQTFQNVGKSTAVTTSPCWHMLILKIILITDRHFFYFDNRSVL